MKSYTDLEAWKKGMQLAKEVYELTKNFPQEEQFGLTSQMRKASTSILANLAEGFSRVTNADKAHKYTIARGECSETAALLHVSVALKIISMERAQKALELSQETGKTLTGLIRAFPS